MHTVLENTQSVTALPKNSAQRLHTRTIFTANTTQMQRCKRFSQWMLSSQGKLFTLWHWPCARWWLMVAQLLLFATKTSWLSTNCRFVILYPISSSFFFQPQDKEEAQGLNFWNCYSNSFHSSFFHFLMLHCKKAPLGNLRDYYAQPTVTDYVCKIHELILLHSTSPTSDLQQHFWELKIPYFSTIFSWKPPNLFKSHFRYFCCFFL